MASPPGQLPRDDSRSRVERGARHPGIGSSQGFESDDAFFDGGLVGAAEAAGGSALAGRPQGFVMAAHPVDFPQVGAHACRRW